MRSFKIFTPMLVALAAQSSFAKYEAHEWGTFTSMVGSDGKAIHGMYHEDEILPDFVHGFGAVRGSLSRALNFNLAALTAAEPPRPNPPPPPLPPCRGKGCFDSEFYDTNILTQKMETPVIYFYGDREETVRVNVKFPNGIITETFPAPIMTSPNRQDPPRANLGDTTFEVDILNATSGQLPLVTKESIYQHSRSVPDANVVRSGDEQEKFIFYRGLGAFSTRLQISSRILTKYNRIYFGAHYGYKSPSAFLVHVDQQSRSKMMVLGEIASFRGDPMKSVRAQDLDQLQDHAGAIAPQETEYPIVSGSQMKASLVSALQNEGLTRHEALAIVNTWEHGYLKVPGLRLLYVLSQKEVKEILPLQMTPEPEKLVRAFVGRIEILTDEAELRYLDQIETSLISTGTFDLGRLGRFAEPIVRRVFELYQKRYSDAGETPPEVRMRQFRILIQRAGDLG